MGCVNEVGVVTSVTFAPAASLHAIKPSIRATTPAPTKITIAFTPNTTNGVAQRRHPRTSITQ